ncbi:sigma-70 family RNA polymerase sigma factor [Kitasatospora sp. NBC_00240]|uniref:sigma-70 family RNA polymerase sigma factor n=1 Tax=Kitasatospora sp. NBC_00240 TaxID=2903567 RepID=UPI002257BD8B|nr:sigma-70 family RNA polymerase sigma factor [Kitasatospora sp. NBC_00240]MCX5214436.1 sigma-70 family RNA polymerase sigma factor [Kitasatospora sp. NBC_00240]
MNSANGAATVAAAQAGDERAQGELIAEYLPLVYNIVGRALSGHADVDDVVQETMLRVVDGLGSLRDASCFRSWLVAIAMNEVRRRQRAHSSEALCDGLHEAQEVADPGADFVGLTIVRLGLSGQRREVTEATRWLDQTDRELLALWWLEAAGELTRADVAVALGQSQQHVTVRVQRMKTQLEVARVVVRALSALPPCEELDSLTGAWDGAPGSLWRKRIARHARDCVPCGGHRNGLVPAEGLLAGLAFVPVPEHLGGLLPTAFGSAGSGAGAGAAATPAAPPAPVPVPAPAPAPAPAPSPGGTTLQQLARRPFRQGPGAPAVLGSIAAVAAVACLAYVVPEGPRPADVRAVVAPTAEPAALPTVSEPPSPAPPLPEPSVTVTAPEPPAAASPSAPPSPKPSPKPVRAPATVPPPVPVAVPSVVPVVALDPFERQLVDLLNSERTKQGCAPLRVDPRLSQAAQQHSDDMAARGYFGHTDPDGVTAPQRIVAAGYHWTTYAENIGFGRDDATVVVGELMNTPDHRAHILNCAFKDIGVGAHFGPGGPWWTQDFGTAR